MSNMTSREQIEQRAEEHAWVGDMYDPKANYKAGAEYGYNLAIENVVEWLCMNMTETAYIGVRTTVVLNKPELINNLKKAMKLCPDAE